MSAFRISLTLMLCLPVTLNAEAPPEWITQPIVIVELRSYGEQPQDMVELLLPFVANLGFTGTMNSTPLREAGINRAMLRYSDGDLIGFHRAFNCVVLEYFVTRPWRPLRGGPSSKERGQTFKTSLSSFLRGLPTPRLSTHYLDWGSTFCAHAP
jgi:hypothetical protein